MRRLKVNWNIHDEEAEDYESEVEEEDEDSDSRPGLMDSSSDKEEEEVIDYSNEEDLDIPKPLTMEDLDYSPEECSESSFSVPNKFGMSFAGPQGHPRDIRNGTRPKTPAGKRW